ncbi:hypothetical protein BKA83DRAFT_4230235 [Pisolithus microcarpus]|nr:hypothetical protein BKA83DRAFT_4230235 [Pisolithus microcarpus]
MLNYLDSVVICHPAPVSIKEIKVIKIPPSWICAEGRCSFASKFCISYSPPQAEDDMFFKKKRMLAEAIFVKCKDSGDVIAYEFVNYKGQSSV